RDAYMRGKGIDYFENSRRATIAQHEYAIANPNAWRDYGSSVWGLTASDGPYDTLRLVDGRMRQFHTYWARGAASTEQPDDGTIAPTAAGGSVPFAPRSEERRVGKECRLRLVSVSVKSKMCRCTASNRLDYIQM